VAEHVKFRPKQLSTDTLTKHRRRCKS